MPGAPSGYRERGWEFSLVHLSLLHREFFSLFLSKQKRMLSLTTDVSLFSVCYFSLPKQRQ